MSDEFRHALEAIKLRAPIEEIVRERLPALRKAGALWVACCPFHDERTPSFKVDPRRGSWHCFGACATGGDQISFLQRLDGLEFLEVVEILAARTGVEMPRSAPGARGTKDGDPALEALAQAEEHFRKALRTREGREAREYLRARGLTENTIEAFGLGWAPAGGQALVELARLGRAQRAYLRAGLVRATDGGRPYDFFRGRLAIPIRDLRGRTVGFGARRLADGGEGAGPKYVNSPDTELFHKGRLIYGLDRALESVRRGGHLVLVEGYTDVMAAHQVGLPQVAAVLGTATTEEHAGLVRRAGARRISLVFDGDAAGRQAAYRALAGLLPLDLALDVVRLPEGRDPCDLLVEAGAEPFLAHLELATSWFEFVLEGARGLEGAELAREVDRILELVLCLPKAVERESMVQRVARELGLRPAAVVEQWDGLPGRRRGPGGGRRASPRPAGADGGREDSGQVKASRPLDPELRRAYERLTGAVLVDASLVPLVREAAECCPDPELATILEHVLALYEDVDATIDESSVMNSLGEHPARERVVPCAALGRAAESPLAMLEGDLRSLERARLIDEQARLAPALERGDERATLALQQIQSRLASLLRRSQGAPTT